MTQAVYSANTEYTTVCFYLIIFFVKPRICSIECDFCACKSAMCQRVSEGPSWRPQYRRPHCGPKVARRAIPIRRSLCDSTLSSDVKIAQDIVMVLKSLYISYKEILPLMTKYSMCILLQ